MNAYKIEELTEKTPLYFLAQHDEAKTVIEEMITDMCLAYTEANVNIVKPNEHTGKVCGDYVASWHSDEGLRVKHFSVLTLQRSLENQDWQSW